MGQMLLHVAPWVVAAFGVVLAAAYAWGRNVNREIAALKGHVGRETSEQPTPRRLPVGLLRAGLYGVAILFIVLGVMNGGLRDVLVKAINICTECIGLG
ncbi:MAG: CD1871A family CXXC motif-containing protein [Oscillospiraceae bacterium]